MSYGKELVGVPLSGSYPSGRPPQVTPVATQLLVLIGCAKTPSWTHSSYQYPLGYNTVTVPLTVYGAFGLHDAVIPVIVGWVTAATSAAA